MYAGVVKLANTWHLSCHASACGFESHRPYFIKYKKERKRENMNIVVSGSKVQVYGEEGGNCKG